MDTDCQMLLKDICDETKVFKLQDGIPLVLGRNRESQIKDTRCSRSQLLITPNYAEACVLIEQVGTNSSAINGIPLRKGEKRKAEHDDVIEVVESSNFFKLEYEPKIASTAYVNDKPSTSTIGITNGAKRPGSLDHFLKDSTLKAGGVWKSIDDDRLWVFKSDSVECREKIAAFDLDGTLITTTSGNVYPKDHNDWKIAFPQVTSKLRALNENGFKLVFFTNQGGIGRGRIKMSNFQMKIEAVVRKLQVPVVVFVAPMDDIYRKPRPGMWNFLVENENDNLTINYDESFFCGDAAGRPANSEPNKKKKDFSASDRLFALNVNLKFFTPEEYFLGWKAAPFVLPKFSAMSLPANRSLLDPTSTKLTSKHQEIIVMIGCSGSGKSFFSKTYLEKAGYVYVNRDTLKTWQKCVNLTEKSIKDKLSVVVDNTSPDQESRSRYTKIAQTYNVPVRAFWMSTTLDHAKHNNTFRQLLKEEAHDYIPNHSIHTFFNTLEPPTLDEGFTEIVRVNFIPKFENEKQRKLYNLYLLD